MWSVLFARRQQETAAPPARGHLTILEVEKCCEPARVKELYKDQRVLVVTVARSRRTPLERARTWLAAVEPPVWAEIFAEQLHSGLRVERDEGGGAEEEPRGQHPGAGAFRTVACGGSFDGCHSGHLALLFRCFQVLDLDARDCRLYLGLMPDRTVRSKTHGELSYSYNTRQHILISCASAFLSDFGFEQVNELSPQARVEEAHYRVTAERVYFNASTQRRVYVQISELDEAGVGCAGYILDLECLVVTTETEKGATYVNSVRAVRGLGALAVSICPLIALAPAEGKTSSRDSRAEFRRRLAGGRCEDLELWRSVIVPYTDETGSVLPVAGAARAAIAAALVDHR